jgi:hypothetical protein
VNEELPSVFDVGVTQGDIIGMRQYLSWRGPQGTGQAEVILIEGAQSGFGSLNIVFRFKPQAGSFWGSLWPAAYRQNLWSLSGLCHFSGLGSALWQ